MLTEREKAVSRNKCSGKKKKRKQQGREERAW